MPIILSSSSGTNTRLTLIQLVGQELGYATGSPSSGGTTTTIIDTSNDSPLDTGDSNTLFQNAWVKIEADSAVTPQNVGEVRRISSYVASTGTITVSRAFSNATTTTMTYGVYFDVPPTQAGTFRGIDQYINDVLRRLFYRRQALLTLVTDGDMETSGVTNWTASNTTLTKSTTTGITLGKQSLRVLNTSANGYAQSATVNVEPSETYYLAADATVNVGTGTLELYDVTNSASIATQSSDEKQSRRIWISPTSLTSTCHQIAVRLNGSGASDDVYWDNVSLLRQGITEMPMPSWFKNHKWLEYVRLWRADGETGSGNEQGVDTIERSQFLSPHIIEDKDGYVPYKVQFGSGISPSTLLVAQSLSPYTELSADTDTTQANPDHVVAWAMAFICRDKGYIDKANSWAARARELDKTYQAKWSGKHFKV